MTVVYSEPTNIESETEVIDVDIFRATLAQ